MAVYRGRRLALIGAAQSARGAAGSLACLLFVLGLALAFWAGAAWTADYLIRGGSLSF